MDGQREIPKETETLQNLIWVVFTLKVQKYKFSILYTYNLSCRGRPSIGKGVEGGNA
jgi:hypothetical protein